MDKGDIVKVGILQSIVRFGPWVCTNDNSNIKLTQNRETMCENYK